MNTTSDSLTSPREDGAVPLKQLIELAKERHLVDDYAAHENVLVFCLGSVVVNVRAGAAPSFLSSLLRIHEEASRSVAT
jgi:hypothetical protein